MKLCFPTPQPPPRPDPLRQAGYGVLLNLFLALFLGILFCSPALAAPDQVLDVQQLKTPGGIEVWLVEDKTVPVISMSFFFDGGLIYDPEDLPGAGRLVSTLLDEGADRMTSRDFQAQLSRHAIQMSFSAGRDAFRGKMKTLKANQALAFDLLRLALNSPRFDADAVERMRNANISQIKDDMGDTGWLVARTYNGMVCE